MEKQVDKEHYLNKTYLEKERFLSYYYQIESVIGLKPRRVLEIGES